MPGGAHDKLSAEGSLELIIIDNTEEDYGLLKICSLQQQQRRTRRLLKLPTCQVAQRASSEVLARDDADGEDAAEACRPQTLPRVVSQRKSRPTAM